MVRKSSVQVDHPALFDVPESRRPPRVFGLPASAWKPPRLADLPDWTGARKVAYDIETCDVDLRRLGPGVRRGAYMIGYSFQVDDGPAFYVPLRHAGGDNVDDPERALDYLRDQAKNFHGAVVGAKLDYDLDFSWEAGVFFGANAQYEDVQVAEPLLDELQYSYGLDNILKRHGLDGKDEELLQAWAAAHQPAFDPKVDMWRAPARYVGPYAEADVRQPARLLRKQLEEIERQDLGKVWDLGCRTLPVLVRMRRRGVAVNFNKLDAVERFAFAEEAKAWGTVARETGVSIQVGDAMKADVVAQALRAAGIEPPLTPSTKKPSIDKLWLENLNHPVANAVRRARKMSQLRTTFVSSIREHAVRGRIHTTFNQTIMEKDGGGGDAGAAFGRFSSQNPNMQQQPARDPEIGPMWRAIFEPDAGGLWASLDFSQQEPGLMLHTAVNSGAKRLGERAYRSALAAAEQKRNDPTVDYHTMFTSFAHGPHVLLMDKKSKELKLLRDPCKNIFLGICYGSGGAKVCHTLNLPTKWIMTRAGKQVEIAGPEGQELLDKVDAGVPWLRKTAEAVEAAAKERGYVMTLYRRRLHFEDDGKGGYGWTYRAMNRVIQGSAAEQTAESMIALDSEGAYLQLQIHDELAETVDSRETAQRHARRMEEAVQLLVPNRVDVEVGPSWGESK